MAFEEATEVGLVGEVEAVGEFLDREVGGEQEEFDFLQEAVVDKGFGGHATVAAGNGGQVTGRYRKRGSVETDVPHRHNMSMQEADETFEEISRTVGVTDVDTGIVARNLVTGIQQIILQ